MSKKYCPKWQILKTDDHEYLIEESLKALEEEFNSRFVRIHRNALVSENHIIGLSKNEAGHQCILMEDTDDVLEISRRHLPAIRKKLKNLSS